MSINYFQKDCFTEWEGRQKKGLANYNTKNKTSNSNRKQPKIINYGKTARLRTSKMQFYSIVSTGQSIQNNRQHNYNQ